MSEEEKIVDLDGAFDKRVAEYLSKKKGKFSEEEWEDKISAFYKAYGDARIESLGATPNEYYKKMPSDVLSRVLREHFRRGVPVDGFLRRALEEAKNRSVLLSLLDGENDEEISFAVDLLGDAEDAREKYYDLLSREIGDALAERIAETLRENAADNKAFALRLYKNGNRREIALDLLCRTLPPDDEVFSILVDSFSQGTSPRGAAAERLGTYGDERALSVLRRQAAREDVGYLEWREMSAAAQALGGELPARDFSRDKDFLALRREEEKRQKERESRFRGE